MELYLVHLVDFSNHNLMVLFVIVRVSTGLDHLGNTKSLIDNCNLGFRIL